MAFDKDEVSKLLAQCHRRCCVCHRFCGVKMELHHVEHKSKGGSDKIENAIPVCFECHAEVNHYNDAHPRGRKFTGEELLAHKKQWLDICANHPAALISAPRDVDVGPLEGMMLELQHNIDVLKFFSEGQFQDRIGLVLQNAEYGRSISQGSLLLLPTELRKSLSSGYAQVGRINTFVALFTNTPPDGNAFANAQDKLGTAYRKSLESIESAHKALENYLPQNRKEEE